MMNKMLRKVTVSGQRGGSWRERGQAMTELALAMIVIILLLSMVLDLGRAFFTYIALQNAAAEGAYYGSAFPENVGTVGTTNKDTIIYRAQNESPLTQQLINWQNAQVEVTYPAGPPRTGEPIEVAITYNFPFVGPIPHFFGVQSINLYARARQTIISSTSNDAKPTALPSNTPVPATTTPSGPTATPGAPTATPGAPTATPSGPTATPSRTATATATATPAGTVHLASLSASSSRQGSSWTADITVTMHDGAHGNPGAGITVSGTWDQGLGSGSCTTNGSGQCTITRSGIPNSDSPATFTVTSHTNPHGSTSITVSR